MPNKVTCDMREITLRDAAGGDFGIVAGYSETDPVMRIDGGADDGVAVDLGNGLLLDDGWLDSAFAPLHSVTVTKE